MERMTKVILAFEQISDVPCLVIVCYWLSQTLIVFNIMLDCDLLM